MRDELILSKIKEAVKILDEIDSLIETQPQELQKVDYELSDLYHYIENEDINQETSIKLIERIKYLRLVRRSLNNEYSIEKAYKDNSSKMMGNGSRPFLMNILSKTVENLNCEYKNRVLTEEDILNLKTVEKKKRGRPKKGEILSE